MLCDCGLDPNKLAAYGVTVADVRSALNKQNVELPSGKITGAATELTVKPSVIYHLRKNLMMLSFVLKMTK